MEAIASEPPGPAWKASLGLSTRQPPELYERSEQVGNTPHSGALRTAFDDLGLSAVFCVEQVPTVAIIGTEYFRDAANTETGTFETLLSAGDGEALEHLFRTLRQDFNGDLFVAPCSFDADDRGPGLDASHLAVLARFRSGREEMHGRVGQYRLWKYDFKYIPIELISAVHDRFLAERGPDRRTSGAYYTPMFLADTVVSHVWDRLPAATRDRGCFLDPAFGSGISWTVCSSASATAPCSRRSMP